MSPFQVSSDFELLLILLSLMCYEPEFNFNFKGSMICKLIGNSSILSFNSFILLPLLACGKVDKGTIKHTGNGVLDLPI